MAVAQRQPFPIGALNLGLYLFLVAVNALPARGSPFPEEIGWRGLALPRLLVRFGPPRATLILGLAWWMWHLPLFWVTRWSGGFTWTHFLFFGLSTMSITVLYTVIYHISGGSVWCGIVNHSAHNTINPMYPWPTLQGRNGGTFTFDLTRQYVIVTFLTAMLLTVCTRGRLFSPRIHKGRHRDEDGQA